MALTLALGACGSDDAKPAKTTATASPQQLAARAKRRAEEKPKFSPPGVTAAVAKTRASERRAALIRAVRRSVLRDARERVKRGELQGHIRDTSCVVTRDDKLLARRDPTAPILRYDCLAITYRSKTKPVMEIGQMFVARVDFGHDRYAWCKRTPVGGEGAHEAETFTVDPSPACVSPPPVSASG